MELNDEELKLLEFVLDDWLNDHFDTNEDYVGVEKLHKKIEKQIEQNKLYYRPSNPYV